MLPGSEHLLQVETGISQPNLVPFFPEYSKLVSTTCHPAAVHLYWVPAILNKEYMFFIVIGSKGRWSHASQKSSTLRTPFQRMFF